MRSGIAPLAAPLRPAGRWSLESSTLVTEKSGPSGVLIRDGRTFPLGEHRPSQGAGRRQAREALHQALPRGLRRRAQRRRRPRRQHAAPLRDRQGALVQRPQGQHRALDQEGDRRARRRELRGSRLRGLWTRRRGRALRGPDRQPQPHRRRAAPGVRGSPAATSAPAAASATCSTSRDCSSSIPSTSPRTA